MTVVPWVLSPRARLAERAAVARTVATCTPFDTEPGDHVVVLVDLRRPGTLVNALSRARPEMVLTVLTTAEDQGRVISSGPAPSLVIDARTRRNSQRKEAFDALFLLLADGGRYVVVAPSQEQAAGDARQLPVTRQLERLAAARSWRPARRRRELSDDARAQSDAIADLEVAPGQVVVRKAGVHVLLLPDGVAQQAMGRRGGIFRELERRPATTFEPRGSLWTSDAEIAARRLRSGPFVVPDRVCAVFEDVLCAPRQLAVVGGVVLPTAYHKPERRPLQHQAVRAVRPGIARARQLEGPVDVLPGTYFHLDNEYAGHYGHVITQDLAKLWSWDRALSEFPDLRVLVSPALAGPPVPGYTIELLGAFGIAPDRVTVLERPARVERLVTSTQAFQQPTFAAPEATEVWARTTRSLLERAGHLDVPERVFVSRRSSMRRNCVNGPEVEELFRDAGFVVVYPEDLSLPEQAALFARASVIAGYAGSALLNLVYSSGPATRIILASTSYAAANEYFLASLHGGDLHYFWCDPVTPELGPVRKEFHWDYRFDMDRDGPDLRALLHRVGAASATA